MIEKFVAPPGGAPTLATILALKGRLIVNSWVVVVTLPVPS